MKRFWRWRHWRAQAKFWRKRALKAEASLEAERWRNLEREDTLVTVPMRLGGLWGMPARTGPAPMKQVNQPPRQLTQSADPWDSLSWADKQEYDMQYKDAAAAMGIPEWRSKQEFLAVVESRRNPINDELFTAN